MFNNSYRQQICDWDLGRGDVSGDVLNYCLMTRWLWCLYLLSVDIDGCSVKFLPWL